MPRLLTKLAASPRSKQRVRIIIALVFGAVAVVSWWGVKVEGASPARVLTAITSSVVVLLEVFLPKRRRLLHRSRSAQGPN